MKKLPFRFNYLFGFGLSMIPDVVATIGKFMLPIREGGVPKWLRERSAKPRCSGSNPLAASKFCLISLEILSPPRPLRSKKTFRSPSVPVKRLRFALGFLPLPFCIFLPTWLRPLAPCLMSVARPLDRVNRPFTCSAISIGVVQLSNDGLGAMPNKALNTPTGPLSHDSPCTCPKRELTPEAGT